MDNSQNLFIVIKNTLNRFFISAIDIVNAQSITGDFFDPVNDPWPGISEIVNDDGFKTGINKFNDCMRTNISGSACYNDLKFFIHFEG